MKKYIDISEAKTIKTKTYAFVAHRDNTMRYTKDKPTPVTNKLKRNKPINCQLENRMPWKRI
jgi:hypothetical protein